MNTAQTTPFQTGAFQVPAGYVLAPAPAPPQTGTSTKARPGYKGRLVTGVIQALLGVTLAICGIVVIALRYPEQDHSDYRSSSEVRYGSDEGERLDKVDRQAWAIWMGIVIVITSSFGFLSKRNQALISLYMASSIVVSLVAFVGIIVAAQYVGRTANFSNDLKRQTSGIREYYNPCSVDSYRYTTSTPGPSLDLRYNECLDLHIRAAGAHLPFYCIMLICFVVEFVIAIIGASSTCVGLDCCSSSPAQPRQQLVYLQQAPVHMPQPQVTIADPPPPYTSLNFAQPPANQLLQSLSPQPAPHNGPATQAPLSGTGDAYLQPNSTGRRVQTSTLPKPPQQQQQTGDSEYLELDNEPPPGTNPDYVEPITGGQARTDATYLEPNTGGPAQTDATYIEPNTRGSVRTDATYLEPNTGGRARIDATYLEPNTGGPARTDATYLEPNIRGPTRTDATYLEPNSKGGIQNQSYTYDYADPREGQATRNNQAAQPTDVAEEEYITIIP